MDKKCAENNIPFADVPLHNQQNIFKFLKSLFFILHVLIKYKNELKYIWVFEGREHTLCAILKLLFPYLWKGKMLVRVRGQAQNMNGRFFSRILSQFLYGKLTDKVVSAAKCIQKKINFELSPSKSFVHYYGKGHTDKSTRLKEYFFHNQLPPLNNAHFILLVIARFDPIKGHDLLLKSFLEAEFKDAQGKVVASQLVFVGYDASFKAQDLYEKYFDLFDNGHFVNNKFYLENKTKNKNLFIINEKINDLEKVIKMASFGVIASLGSEVICRVGVEFLQHGTPVVSSDAGALTEVFSDFPNLIFSSGNAKELKDKLEKSFNFYLQTEKYDALRLQAERVWQNHFSGDNYASLIERLQK